MQVKRPLAIRSKVDSIKVCQVTPCIRMRLEWPLVVGSHLPVLYANKLVHLWDNWTVFHTPKKKDLDV